MTLKTAVMILVSVLSVLTAASAGPLTLESPENRVVFLELYTSQGCSSCPPADAWLSTLKADPRLWRELVPVAWHVDYWDDLGWRDRFATAYAGARQAAYLHAGRVSGVYTPGLVLAGREWRGWSARRPLVTGGNEAAGVLRAQVVDRTVNLRFEPTRPPTGPLRAHVALLGFELVSPVGRGENAGRTLKEDFVVLAHAQQPMVGVGGGFSASLGLPNTGVRGANPRALATWVSAGDDPAPIQAAGGWLNGHTGGH